MAGQASIQLSTASCAHAATMRWMLRRGERVVRVLPSASYMVLPPDCDTPPYGIKGRCDRRATRIRESAWLTYITRISP
jgi:hypothetical protein